MYGMSVRSSFILCERRAAGASGALARCRGRADADRFCETGPPVDAPRGPPGGAETYGPFWYIHCDVRGDALRITCQVIRNVPAVQAGTTPAEGQMSRYLLRTATLLLILPIAVLPAACGDSGNERAALEEDELDRELDLALQRDSAPAALEDKPKEPEPQPQTRQTTQQRQQ